MPHKHFFLSSTHSYSDECIGKQQGSVSCPRIIRHGEPGALWDRTANFPISRWPVPPQEQQAKPQGKSQKVTIKEYWYQFLVLLPACEQFPWNHKFFTIKLNKQQKESRCFLYSNVFLIHVNEISLLQPPCPKE